jgi:hypothetical protein
LRDACPVLNTTILSDFVGVERLPNARLDGDAEKTGGVCTSKFTGIVFGLLDGSLLFISILAP